MMDSRDLELIERRAHQLRAEEMQRIHAAMSARTCKYCQWIASALLAGLAAISEILRPLFSWNPQTPVSRRHVSQP